MTEALWHFEASEVAAEARELVRRYRRARIGLAWIHRCSVAVLSDLQRRMTS
jgi:hypothetical protein